MSGIIMSEENLHWYWSKRFENVQSLTVDDILNLTIERGQQIEDLLLHLDQSIFPGILSKVATEFLNSRIKKLLPEELRDDSQFESVILNSKAHFDTEDEDELRSLCAEFYIDVVNAGSSDHEKRAMMAFIELGLGQYELALRSAGFAINESHVNNFGSELDRLSLSAQKTLVSVATDMAKILLALVHDKKVQNG